MRLRFFCIGFLPGWLVGNGGHFYPQFMHAFRKLTRISRFSSEQSPKAFVITRLCYDYLIIL